MALFSLPSPLLLFFFVFCFSLILLLASVVFLFSSAIASSSSSSSSLNPKRSHHPKPSSAARRVVPLQLQLRRSSTSSPSPSPSSSCQTCRTCGGLKLAQRRRGPFSSFLYSAIQEVSRRSGLIFSRFTQQWGVCEAEITSVFKQLACKLADDQNDAPDENEKENFQESSSATSAVVVSNAAEEGSNTKDPSFNASSSSSPSSYLSTSHSSSSLLLETSSITCSGMAEKDDSKKKDPHFHRIILEILMSPSDGSEERGPSSTSTSEFKLKLGTDATIGHLSSLKELLEWKMSQQSGDLKGSSPFSLPCDASADTFRDDKTLESDMNSSPMVSVKENAGVTRDRVVTFSVDFRKSEQCDQKQQESPKLQVSGEAYADDHQNCHSLNAMDDVQISNAKTNLGRNTHTCEHMPLQESVNDLKEWNIGLGGSILSKNVLGSLEIPFLKNNTGSDEKRDQDPDKTTHNKGISALAVINVCGKRGNSLDIGSFHNDGLDDASKSYEKGYINVEGEHSLLHDGTCKSADAGGTSTSKKEKKRKKNRGKKQRRKVNIDAAQEEMKDIGKIGLDATKHSSFAAGRETTKGGLDAGSCTYPFTSSGSMLQRKIKEQYDELVRSNASKTLTLSQVGRFTTCLVETKATLQQKSALIQRKFTIAKSLLSKADKSSFDRICGQIYGLEMEQKKLEEDTAVYNRLQEQLKLSPAYKKMLEYGQAHFELHPRTGQLIENMESNDVEISFEEFLAREKKDAFWQKKHCFVKSTAHA